MDTIYNIGKLLALHTYILYIFIMKAQLYDHIDSYICTLNQQARLAEDCQPIKPITCKFLVMTL